MKLAFICLLPVFAQTTGALSVRLTSPDGVEVSEARVTLENPVTGYRKDLAAGSAGNYHLEGIPPQTYLLTIQAAGFEAETRSLSLHSNIPEAVAVMLRLAGVRQSVQVTSSAPLELVDPVATGTRTSLSAEGLAAIPTLPGRRGLETYLAAFPGFAVNANGAIHPRGAHNQMTYVIDGMPIHDQLTGAFATAIEPSIVDSLELYTGDVPAEFGAKVSGVAVISTQSGVGTQRRFAGSVEAGIASFDTRQLVMKAGGAAGRWAYFGSVSAVETGRFLDAVSLDNFHNGGDAERVFVRADYQRSERDTLRLSAMAGRSSFELANLASQEARGMDQRQRFEDFSVWLRWNRILSAASTWETTLAWRPASARLLPSAGDTPVTAAQARRTATLTFDNRWNRVLGRHSLRAGVDAEYFPVREDFRMAITDAAFNVPGSATYNDALRAHDLTRGGIPFDFSARDAGALTSGFVQDLVRFGPLTVSAGLRHDEYRFLVQGRHLQPRAGLAFHLRRTRTVLRASYNRNYQTPPNENLLLSSSEAAGRLAPAVVREKLSRTVEPIQPQRENVYEAGVQQALFKRVSLNASVYHKDSRDQQDNNNFFNTGIIFPVTLAGIRVNGAEARLMLPPVAGFTASLSATHSRAVSSPPFTGGLYIGQDAVTQLSAGPFVIDHDQKLGLQAMAHYTPRKGWWISGAVRHDSGLVANPSDPVAVAGDPDYRALLPYVNLGGSPARVRPRTVVDAAFGYERWRGDRRAWDVEMESSNLGNVTALYNFQSVFVGTRVVAPRVAAVKLRWYW